MSRSNYHSRHFSKETKAQTYNRQIDAEGVARCANCTAALESGRINYDHVIPWELSRYSGPSNCQALCLTCHRLKTGNEDVPTIAHNNALRASHIGARTKPRHPFPAGRKSRWSKGVGAFGLKPRMNLAQKHRAYLAQRFPYAEGA